MRPALHVMLKAVTGSRGLFVHRGSARVGDVLHQLNGPVIPFPTKTSVQVSEARHVEDKLGAFVNHSCEPSAVVHSSALVAVKELKVGDEVGWRVRPDGAVAFAAP